MKTNELGQGFRVSSYESSIECFVFISNDTLNKNQHDFIFFCCKKQHLFNKFLVVFLLLIFLFSVAAVRRCSRKQVFLKVLQNSRLCRGLCFNKVGIHVWTLLRNSLQNKYFPVNFAWNLLRKRFRHKYFPVDFAKILRKYLNYCICVLKK